MARPIRIPNAIKSGRKARTRKITKREIRDIWTADLQHHTILREIQLGSKIKVRILGEIMLRRFAWIQNGKLGTPDMIFDFVLCVFGDGVAEIFSPSFTILECTTQPYDAIPWIFGTRETTFCRASGLLQRAERIEW